MRYVTESGHAIGDRLAEANERIQENAQAGTQDIRDVRLFGLETEIFEEFSDALDTQYRASVTAARNQAAMSSFYELLTAVLVFVLYVALGVASLPVAALGVFLFAIFRLAPRVSTLNTTTYSIANNLPHLVRTQEFVDELVMEREPDDGEESVPRVREIAHRLSTVRNADRIYAMEDSRVTEAGPHDNLVEVDGTYAALYAAQRGG